MNAGPVKSDLPAGLGKPAQRALAGAGYTRLDQLVGRSEKELLKMHGMGPKALGLIRIALAERGQSLEDRSPRSITRRSDPMNDDLTTALVRRYFSVYQAADREQMETLLADDFTFTSPWDDHIDRATYFSHCFPHAGSFRFREPMTIFARGDEAFVRYETEGKPGGMFRNAEFFRIDGGRIRSIEVFFGFIPGATAIKAAVSSVD